MDLWPWCLQESPLFSLDKPVLFVLGNSDAFCSPSDLKSVASQLPAPDIRVELFEVRSVCCWRRTLQLRAHHGSLRRVCRSVGLRALGGTGRPARLKTGAASLQDADGEFKSPTQGKGPSATVLRRLCSCILDFLVALEENSLEQCELRRLKDILQGVGAA